MSVSASEYGSVTTRPSTSNAYSASRHEARRDTPDAVLAALHRQRAASRSQQRDGARGRRPDRERRHAALHAGPSCACARGVEVVEHARDLDRRAIDAQAAPQDLAHRDVGGHDAAAQRPLAQLGLQRRDRRHDLDAPLAHPARVEHAGPSRRPASLDAMLETTFAAVSAERVRQVCGDEPGWYCRNVLDWTDNDTLAERPISSSASPSRSS